MIKETVADWMLMASSAFNWLSTKFKNGAIWVLNTRRRRRFDNRGR